MVDGIKIGLGVVVLVVVVLVVVVKKVSEFKGKLGSINIMSHGEFVEGIVVNSASIGSLIIGGGCVEGSHLPGGSGAGVVVLVVVGAGESG